MECFDGGGLRGCGRRKGTGERASGGGEVEGKKNWLEGGEWPEGG